MVGVLGRRLECVAVCIEEGLGTVEPVVLIVALEALRLPASLEVDILAIPLGVCCLIEVCGPGLVFVALGDW